MKWGALVVCFAVSVGCLGEGSRTPHIIIGTFGLPHPLSEGRGQLVLEAGDAWGAVRFILPEEDWTDGSIRFGADAPEDDALGAAAIFLVDDGELRTIAITHGPVGWVLSLSSTPRDLDVFIVFVRAGGAERTTIGFGPATKDGELYDEIARATVIANATGGLYSEFLRLPGIEPREHNVEVADTRAPLAAGLVGPGETTLTTTHDIAPGLHVAHVSTDSSSPQLARWEVSRTTAESTHPRDAVLADAGPIGGSAFVQWTHVGAAPTYRALIEDPLPGAPRSVRFVAVSVPFHYKTLFDVPDRIDHLGGLPEGTWALTRLRAS